MSESEAMKVSEQLDVSYGEIPSSMVELWNQFENHTMLSESHKILHRFVGNWRMRVDFDMAAYGPQFIAKGKTENTLLFGGRYLQMKVSTVYADRPYEAIIVYNFDSVMEKFCSVLYDNYGTGFMVTEGKWDARAQSIVEKGMVSNPMFGGRHQMESTLRFVNEDLVIYQMRAPDGNGGMVKTMEVRYDRLAKE